MNGYCWKIEARVAFLSLFSWLHQFWSWILKTSSNEAGGLVIEALLRLKTVVMLLYKYILFLSYMDPSW